MTAAIPQPKQEKIKRYIEAGGLVVALEVPVIYAEEEPDEPLLEAETIRFLDEVTMRAKARDMAWLSRVGQVYEQRSA
jgi:hypothetical protein